MTSDNDILKDLLTIQEPAGLARQAEPIRFGLPLARGWLRNIDALRLLDENGRPIACQRQLLSSWPDGSARWVLLDFSVDLAAGRQCRWSVDRLERAGTAAARPAISARGRELIINDGTRTVVMATDRFNPLLQVTACKIPLIGAAGLETILSDDRGRPWRPVVDTTRVEAAGPVRTTVYQDGFFRSRETRKRLLRFETRIHLWSGQPYIRIDFSIHNPKAARHLGGLWDLGDAGSVFFQDLSFRIPAARCEVRDRHWAVIPEGPKHESSPQQIVIYQDSSGGENWNASTHVDRNGRVPCTFRGYRVSQDGKVVAEGDRATPEVGLQVDGSDIGATVEHFWQNFPKALEIENDTIIVRLFPKYYASPFELQGGEKKTHRIFLQFEYEPRSLAWVHQPIVVRLDPDHFCGSGALTNLIPVNGNNKSPLQLWIEEAVSGPNTFFDRREVIDEYGWRNFGDLFADHETYEAVDHPQEKPWVSHYNNQYDVLYGALCQWARTADIRWWRLADELARHVMDIDIYHTDEDRSAFSGGLFWHTDHFTDAYTATHRGASIHTKIRKGLVSYGSGPSFDHLYCRGLLAYYWMTGASQAVESVRELARWGLRGFGGVRTVAETIEGFARKALRGAKRLLHRTPGLMPYGFNGPGRPSGNCLNAFVDAYRLDGEESCLQEAERLIRCCIHPGNDVNRHDLLDPNIRWMYTVFLQALGHYLQLKEEIGQFDNMHVYARDSLLHYARWMAANEYPLLSKPERLDYPNFATRAAQDIRKSVIWWTAARYASAKDRAIFVERAETFYRSTVGYLEKLETRTLTRPLAILLANTSSVDYYRGDGLWTPLTTSQLASFKMRLSTGRNYTRLARRLSYLSLGRELNFISQRLETMRWERHNRT